MEPIKARALVIHEYEAGESDKRLLLLCKDHGKIMAYARGAKKPKSKFMAASQIFTYADFILTKGPGFYSVAQAEVIESFYPLRQDYDRLMTAYKILETCKKTIWDNINYDPLLLLILKSFQNLCKDSPNSIMTPQQIYCVFIHRFYDFSGVSPQLESCIVCNTALKEINEKVFVCTEGLCCKNHRPINSKAISYDGLIALKFIIQSEMPKAFLFNASTDIINQLNQYAELIWDAHFGQPFTN